METELTVASDEWRTIHRALPKDIYDSIRAVEHQVADLAGVGKEGLGASVIVWTILGKFLNDPIINVVLVELAKDWSSDANQTAHIES